MGLNFVGPLITWVFFSNYIVSIIGYKAADSMGDVVDRNGKEKMYRIKPMNLRLLAPCSHQRS